MVQLVIPDEVVDTDDGGVISESGPQTFTVSELVSILVAIDDDAEVDTSHANDVAVWQALAQTAPVAIPPEPVPLDDLDRPIAPATVEELVVRLVAGRGVGP